MLFWLLLQRSYANSVLQNSGLDSRDILDSPAYFTEASMGSNLLLDDLMEYDPNLASSVSLTGANIIQPESDVGLLTNLNVTAFKSDDLFISADFDLLVTDDYCSTQSPNGKRKRNSASCPVPKVPPKLDIQDDDSPTQPEAATISPSGDEKNPECEEKVFGLGRTFDVCCNGPYGPFAIDDRTRLVYNWIGDCRLGVSRIWDSFLSRTTDSDELQVLNSLVSRKKSTPVVVFGL